MQSSIWAKVLGLCSFDIRTNSENNVGTLHNVKLSLTWNIGSCTAIVGLLTNIYNFITYLYCYTMASVPLIELQQQIFY